MAGRPRKYKNISDLEKVIDSYLSSEAQCPTITGLALSLDFASRQSVYDAIDRSDEFSYIIKKAALRIENFWEKQLIKNNNSGAIFWLKNRGWTDKQELQHSGGDKPVSIKVQYIDPKK